MLATNGDGPIVDLTAVSGNPELTVREVIGLDDAERDDLFAAVHTAAQIMSSIRLTSAGHHHCSIRRKSWASH